MADRRDKLNKTLIMIGIVSAVVVIIIAKIFQMKPQSLISVIAVIWAALVVARMFIVNSKNKEYSKMLEHLNRILGEENDPERYIEMCNNYINRVDDESFKAMLMTNLAAGYADMMRHRRHSKRLMFPSSRKATKPYSITTLHSMRSLRERLMRQENMLQTINLCFSNISEQRICQLRL